MEISLSTEQWDRLCELVDARDRAKCVSLLDAIYLQHRRKQIEAAEDAKRQCRRGEPWIPER